MQRCGCPRCCGGLDYRQWWPRTESCGELFADPRSGDRSRWCGRCIQGRRRCRLDRPLPSGGSNRKGCFAGTVSAHTIKKGELPHCVTACPNGVFYFGDKYEDTVTNGEESLRLSKLLQDKHGYRLMEGLGTKPSVYYLPPVDRLVDFEDGMKDFTDFKSVDKLY